eukprot:gb/GFBE01004739.1/.p1 GENE.gb/GFBE01004739.1/~~gb/GFBE01004739.1/.p1  ORF type:complete len:106 (+),score=18.92 gb/GFBE01004739.1/:1-318(+)
MDSSRNRCWDGLPSLQVAGAKYSLHSAGAKRFAGAKLESSAGSRPAIAAGASPQIVAADAKRGDEAQHRHLQPRAQHDAEPHSAVFCFSSQGCAGAAPAPKLCGP